MQEKKETLSIEENLLRGCIFSFGEKELKAQEGDLNSLNAIDATTFEGDALIWHLIAINYNATTILLSAQFLKTDTRPIIDRHISYAISYVTDVNDKTYGLIFESPIPLHKVVLENEKIQIIKDKGEIDATEYTQDIPENDD